MIKSLLLISSLLLLLTACGVEVDPRTIIQNRLAVKEFVKGSVTDSQKSFFEALKNDPFIGELHINLGMTYHALKQGDAAVQSYESAEKWGRNKEVLFNSKFNQGVIRGENKQIDIALNDYQRSLGVKPESIEAKTNIELLVQGQSGSGEGKGEDKKDGDKGQDKKTEDKKGEGDSDKEEEKDPTQPKQVEKNKEYKPREFKGELSENDVKKILGELKQQEQKIRGQFYRGDSKEKPRDKDW